MASDACLQTSAGNCTILKRVILCEKQNIALRSYRRDVSDIDTDENHSDTFFYSTNADGVYNI